MTELVYKNNLEKIIECKFEIAKGKTLLLPQMLKFIDTEALTNDEMREIAGMYNMTPAAVNSYIRKFTANTKVEETLGVVPSTEYEFVDSILDKWNTTMTFSEIFTIDTPYTYEGTTLAAVEFKALDPATQAKLKDIDPKMFPLQVMLNRIYKSHAELGLKYTEKQLQNALVDWKYRHKNEIIADIKGTIAYAPHKKADADAWWDIFTQSITKTNVAETKVVLQHFIWQVKRKMASLEVDHHMMPVMVGDQGIGKSTVIRKFTNPIVDFVAYTDFGKISDDRYHTLWDNYILVFDEMSKAVASDIDAVKRRITESTFDSRILSTNVGTKIVNKAAFLGSSNRDTSRLIFDDTGMRRFFQISCARNFDREIINSINYLALWQSINEQAPSPLVRDQAMFDRIAAIQDEKRRIGIVEQFLLERDYSQHIEKLQATPFFQEFQEFEKQLTPKNEYTQSRFGSEVMDIYHRIPGLNMVKKEVNGKIYYHISRDAV